jgi:hypothetical protein
MHASATPEAGVDWLAGIGSQRCLFAVAPDAYPDTVESQRRGLEYAPLIRDLGFPVAVVAQDAAEALDWPWGEIDCLFLGGMENRGAPWREWKVSEGAASLTRRARNAGKWVHMGRVNSPQRMARAHRMGVLSCDGTAIKYRKRRRKGEGEGVRHERGETEVVAWVTATNLQPVLWTWEIPELPFYRELLLRDELTAIPASRA